MGYPASFMIQASYFHSCPLEICMPILLYIHARHQANCPKSKAQPSLFLCQFLIQTFSAVSRGPSLPHAYNSLSASVSQGPSSALYSFGGLAGSWWPVPGRGLALCPRLSKPWVRDRIASHSGSYDSSKGPCALGKSTTCSTTASWPRNARLKMRCYLLC